MPRLIPCSSCHAHVMLGERECPHCGAALRTTTAGRASVVLMGLALAGCPGDDEGTTSGEPEYGVPDTSTVTATDTDTDGMSMEGTSTGDGATTSTGPDTAGEAEYGVAETTGEPDYGVAETSTGASTSVGEPEYGVPETTSG